MPRGKLKAFKYRVAGGSKDTPDWVLKDHHTFAAPNQEAADRYAARWARRMGCSQVTRLKKKPKV